MASWGWGGGKHHVECPSLVWNVLEEPLHTFSWWAPSPALPQGTSQGITAHLHRAAPLHPPASRTVSCPSEAPNSHTHTHVHQHLLICSLSWELILLQDFHHPVQTAAYLQQPCLWECLITYNFRFQLETVLQKWQALLCFYPSPVCSVCRRLKRDLSNKFHQELSAHPTCAHTDWVICVWLPKMN